MKNETTPDLDREIAKKLRRRWWKGPLLLSGAFMIASVLSSLMVKNWSDPNLFVCILLLLSAIGCLFTFIVGFLIRLIDVTPVKNIEINNTKNRVIVTYYARNEKGVGEKEQIISLSTNALFYEPEREGTMLRDDVITVPRPDDFAAWFSVLRDAEGKSKRRLGIDLPVHRVLPPTPTPQLALGAAHCQVCGGAFEADRPLIACSKCKTPHHKDCWAYIGKCSIFNCGETNYQET